MRAYVRSSVAIVAFALVSGSISAQASRRSQIAEDTSGGTMSMRPAAELDQLKWMEGKWSCSGTASTPEGTSYDTRSGITIKRDLDGHFFVGDYRQDKSKAAPEMRGNWVVGYDGSQYSVMSYDSSGAMSTEKGTYKDGTLSLGGDSVMGGKQMKMRETVMRRGDKEVLHRVEAEMDGKWTTLQTETCRK